MSDLIQSWLPSANSPDSEFPLNNLPYGVFSVADGDRRCGIAIGNRIVDVTGLEAAGLLRADPDAEVLDAPFWNDFMDLGPQVWATTARERGQGKRVEAPEVAMRETQAGVVTGAKHGILFNAMSKHMNLDAPPKELTTRDMSVPTCETCHMSGLEGLQVTHDVTDRLSWWLFAPISKKRQGYTDGQEAMQDVCLKCHARTEVDRFYKEAEAVVVATNDKVQESLDLMAALRKQGLLTDEPFDEPIEFIAFDLWHYYGRTAKHGAFMGGADFVQWHGNYELLLKMVEMKEIAHELRSKK